MVDKDTHEERWAPVPGLDGGYEVSDLGRVRSWMRTGRRPVNRPPTRLAEPRLLGMHYEALGGYFVVNLSRKPYLVHHLVLTAFDRPRPEGQEGRHLDGNRHNNALANLAWGT